MDDYVEYHHFWTELIDESGIDLSRADYGEVKRLDDALWSIGKHLKSFPRSEDGDKKSTKASDLSSQHSMDDQFRVQVDRNTKKYDTSSPEFKTRVLLYCESMTQSAAMRRAADELGVPLPPSYLAHSGSHIYRWRRQGYPKKI